MGIGRLWPRTSSLVLFGFLAFQLKVGGLRPLGVGVSASRGLGSFEGLGFKGFGVEGFGA